ncbi:late sexual development protein [Lentithecium fluviatile CBS 122367]|uniref:Late sexual development protein n=1 Tax=Lentithecium fluviatile CBS 122367 TaxID=1168545 RepID=A0A6G1J0U0_9PLEO|nr:late sexual development protein [Lentithecium fluviatile CBS 122367]
MASALPTNIKRNDFPLENGFPNPSQDAILGIQKRAGGTLPNGPPPTALSEAARTSLKVIALQENMEVYYFSELIHNVTNKVPGYDLGSEQEVVLDTLNAILAQEELHALNANGALKKFGEEPIEPCQYAFPVTDFQSAMNLANKFTSLVLGTLQDVSQTLAQNGDFGLVRGISSVTGQEGGQNTFFGGALGKRASSQPFLTTSDIRLAFAAVQGLIIPGSCPNIQTIPLETLKPLNVLTPDVKPETQNIKMSFAKADVGTDDLASLSVVWISGQNQPIVLSLRNPVVEGELVKFDAHFPYDVFVMDGLSIALVVRGKGPFATAADATTATMYGPALVMTTN